MGMTDFVWRNSPNSQIIAMITKNGDTEYFSIEDGLYDYLFDLLYFYRH